MGTYTYKAFISYSHKDRTWARWLHRKLETYTFPKNLMGTQSDIGPVLRNLKPIFRDREELSAGHNLGEKIEAALKASENLIIICSPHAAQSHWVNQEILFFKRHNRGAKIFSVIVKGEPFASNTQEECFPQGLRFDLDEAGELSSTPAEPLAADLKESGDGKRLGVLKLISGMAGLGLNDLVQRDLQRVRKRVTAITASAAAIVLAMGGLTWTALDARDEAEQRRNDAEGQIEFMLTDLRDEVEKVGRLDALKVVGDRALEYYNNNQDYLSNSRSMARYSRTLQYLGEIELKNLERSKDANLEQAKDLFERAVNNTKALYLNSPENPDVIFDHSQAIFWRGNTHLLLGNSESAYEDFETYSQFSKKLKNLEPSSERGQTEHSLASLNLAVWYYFNNNNIKALELVVDIIPPLEKAMNLFPESQKIKLDLAEAYAWVADFNFNKNANISVAYRKKQKDLLYKLIDTTQGEDDLHLRHKKLTAISGLSRALIEFKKCEDAIKLIEKNISEAVRMVEFDRTNTHYLETKNWMCKHHERAKKCVIKNHINYVSNTLIPCKL